MNVTSRWRSDVSLSEGSDSETKRILMLCSVAHQFPILAPVAEKIQVLGWKTHFLSLDAYYEFATSEAYLRGAASWSRLPNDTNLGTWFRVGQRGKEKLLSEARRQAERFVAHYVPDVVLVCNDIGFVEQMVLRAAESCQCRTVWMQHGLFLTDRLPPNARVVPLGHGDGGCDLNCLWGEDFASRLEARGVCGKIAVTGNPRYDSLKRMRRDPVKKDNLSILVAGQAFSRYGHCSAKRELAIYQSIFDILTESGETELRFKLHPQQEPGNFRNFRTRYRKRVTLIGAGDSLDLLEGTDLLITVYSTFAIEAILAGVPTLLLSYLFPEYELPELQEYPYRCHSVDEFRRYISHREFPNNLNLEEVERKRYEKRSVRALDGQSASLVSKALRELVSPVATQADPPGCRFSHHSLKCSVIIPWENGNRNCLAALKSVLREDGTEAILLVHSPGDMPPKEIWGLDSVKVAGPFTREGTESPLEAALALAGGSVVIRMQRNSVLLNGCPQLLVGLLSRHKGAALATTHFLTCNASGIFRHRINSGNVTIPLPLVAFRKSDLDACLELLSGAFAERELMTQLSMLGPLVVCDVPGFYIAPKSTGSTVHPLRVLSKNGFSSIGSDCRERTADLLDYSAGLNEDLWERRDLIYEALCAGVDPVLFRGRDEDRLLYLWGTGSRASEMTKVLTSLDFPISGYVDSDESNLGSRFFRRRVISPEDLSRLNPRPFVFIASWYVQAISSTLRSIDFFPGRDFLPDIESDLTVSNRAAGPSLLLRKAG